MQLPFKKYKILGTCMLYLQSTPENQVFHRMFYAIIILWFKQECSKITLSRHPNGGFEKLLGNTLIFVRLHYKVKIWSKADSKRVGLKDAH